MAMNFCGGIRVASWIGLMLLSACGAAQPEGEPPPSEATLCKIVIGETTEDETRDVLGPEWTSTSVVEFSRLFYQYGEAPDAVFVTLTFGADGRFEDAVVTGIAFPDCWKGGQDDDFGAAVNE